MDGIYRYIRLLIDPKSARDLEKDAKDALDKGTDPSKAKKNLGAVEQAMQGIRRAALALGATIAAAFTVRAIGRFLTSSLRAADELRRSRVMLQHAVENEGTAWANVAYQVDQVTKALWETHRLTEGEVNPILRTLIQVTGDYENSLKAVGLAADLAAALQMDQVTAARLLGRVLRGETTALTRYGIEIREGADAVQVLTERLGGMAKAAAPPTVQLTKAWNDLKEAIGEALIDASAGESIIERLVIAVQALTRYVSENGETWRRWGTALISATTSVFRVVRDTFGGLTRLIINLRLEMLQASLAFQKFYQRFHPSPVVRREMQSFIAETTRDIQRLNALLLDLSTPRTPRTTPPAPTGTGLGAPRVMGREGAGDGVVAEVQGIGPVRIPGLVGTDVERIREQMYRAFGESLFIVEPKRAQKSITWIDAMLDRIKERQAEIAHSAQMTAYEMTDAFQGFFDGMIAGFQATGSMVDGFLQGLKGFGLSVASSMAEGMAELQMAEGTAKLAAGTWPPQPPAIKAASLHFAAAGMFKSLSAMARRSGAAARGSISSGMMGTMPTSSFDRQAPEINIYIDPLNPSNPAWQSNLAQTLRGVSQRYGSANVNVRPRTA